MAKVKIDRHCRQQRYATDQRQARARDTTARALRQSSFSSSTSSRSADLPAMTTRASRRRDLAEGALVHFKAEIERTTACCS